MWEEYGEAID
jgi:hypothetical protein